MRARTRNLLLLAALLATALLAFLLLRDGAHDRTGRESPSGVDPAAAAAPSRRASPSRPASAAGDTPADPLPGGPHLDLRAVVEGDWGLAGIEVLALERLPDGSIEAWIGDDAPDGGETDGDGRITLRYKAEPAERLFAVVGDEAVLGTVENAEPAGEVHGLRAFRAKSKEPVTLRYRDKEGLVLLRPVDAATGEILARRRGIRTAWTWNDPGEEPQEERGDPVEKAPGWLRIDGVGDPGVSDLRLLVPGYLPSPAPPGGWKGRSVVALKPDPAAVRGRIALPEGWSVTGVLRSTEGVECSAAGLCGLPAGAGPFVMGGVPQGEWDLVVSASRDVRVTEEISWATRRFRFDGAGLDLGEIRPLPGAVMKVRLLGEEGKPTAASYIRIERCRPGEIPMLGYNRGPRTRESVNIGWPDRDIESWSADHEAGEEGWAVFRGLPPGATFLVATPLVPGLTRTVLTPASPGEELAVELDGACRKTACVLHFTLEGETAAFWGGLWGPAYADQFSTGKGILEADIPPGRYRFGARGSQDAETEFKPYYGEVEVPEGGRFEGTVDLRLRRP